jgi:hypothetical protein
MADPTDAIMQAIHSAFDSYPREECAHLTKAIIRELEARGFQIVKK